MNKIFILVLSIVLLGWSKSALSQSIESHISYPESVMDTVLIQGIKDCQRRKEFSLPGVILKHLHWSDSCINPTMIVIHYSGEWSDPEETLSILNNRGLSCHLATQGNKQIQMLNMYEDRVERAGCAAGYNNFAIHNELSGIDFDSVIENPYDHHYDELISSSNTAVKSTCTLLRQYKIPLTQVFGHYEITPDKPDPGPLYMKYFRNRLKKECL